MGLHIRTGVSYFTRFDNFHAKKQQRYNMVKAFNLYHRHSPVPSSNRFVSKLIDLFCRQISRFLALNRQSWLVLYEQCVEIVGKPQRINLSSQQDTAKNFFQNVCKVGFIESHSGDCYSMLRSGFLSKDH